jgi:hypothetical protein
VPPCLLFVSGLSTSSSTSSAFSSSPAAAVMSSESSSSLSSEAAVQQLNFLPTPSSYSLFPTPSAIEQLAEGSGVTASSEVTAGVTKGQEAMEVEEAGTADDALASVMQVDWSFLLEVHISLCVCACVCVCSCVCVCVHMCVYNDDSLEGKMAVDPWKNKMILDKSTNFRSKSFFWYSR